MNSSLVHDALLYDSDREFVDSLIPFLLEGLDLGEAICVVSRSHNWELLRDGLGARAEAVRFIDSIEWYQTPPRTIAGYHTLIKRAVAGGAPGLRVVGEVEFGAGEIEHAEWIRYESILNIVFESDPAWIVCPYDTQRLPADIIESVRRTHPHAIYHGQRSDMQTFTDPKTFAAALPIDVPLRLLDELNDIDNLRAVRKFTSRALEDAGLSSDRGSDIGVVVNEIATNALIHGDPPVRIRAWGDDDVIVFEVTDRGAGSFDPLSGFLPPDVHQTAGRGLWLSRQLADRLEIATGISGNSVRVAVALR